MNYFKNLREILSIKRSILAWANSHDLSSADCTFVYPWSDWTDPETAVVVIFNPVARKQATLLGYETVFYTRRVWVIAAVTNKLSLSKYEDEREEWLVEARSIIERTIQGTPQAEEMTEETNLQHTADVAVYCRGQLRGSMVARAHTLKAAVIRAAETVTNDVRFKPLTPAELPDMTVEISLAHDLWLETTASDYREDRSLVGKMYRVDVANRTKAWYVPGIIALSGFATMQQLSRRLINEKARLTGMATDQAVVKVATGTTWHEGEVSDTTYQPNEFLEQQIDYLLQQIDVTGFVQVLHTQNDSSGIRLDVVRTAFVVKTLREIQNYSNYRKEEVVKAKHAVETFLGTLPTGASISEQTLVQCYMDDINGDITAGVLSAETATESEFFIVVQKVVYQLRNKLPLTASEVIPLYQYWRQHKEDISLASLPDILLLLEAIGERAKRAEVGDWLLSMQQVDGSFPNRSGSNFCYTRGTSKIAESLAAIPEYSDVVKKAFQWLSSMRYNKDNSYQIAADYQAGYIGGIRHDVWGHEVWLDSSCHTIIALLRDQSALRANDTPR